jgi:SAM-dependent methyltransferase
VSGQAPSLSADAATLAPGATGTRPRDCPICDDDRYRLLLEHPPWRLVECESCGLAYLPEIPTDEAIETDFDWAESFARERRARWAESPLARLWTGLLLWLKPSRERRALRVIRRWAAPGRLLDVGCGDGRLAAAARRAGFDPIGVELSPRMAAKARRRLGDERVICGRLEDAKLAPASFDVVVTVSFMEHEPEPLRAAERMRELLRPGGVCVHKVPNYDSLLRRIRGRRWSGFRWPEHVQYFTPVTLARLMSRAGFCQFEVRANSLSDNFWLAARREA